MNIEAVTWATTAGDTVEVYVSMIVPADDRPTEWRYRIRAANQKVVEIGSEGYTRKSAAIRAAKRHHPEVTA